jgi:hypothetical protein
MSTSDSGNYADQPDRCDHSEVECEIEYASAKGVEGYLICLKCYSSAQFMADIDPWRTEEEVNAG